MSIYVERASELRRCTAIRYQCAPAVFIPFAEKKGMDTRTAMLLAHNFSGGERRGATCGAVAGGIMALGLYGLTDASDVQEFYRRFKINHDGLLDCSDLLQKSLERGEIKKQHCDHLVIDAVSIVESMLLERDLL